MTNTIEILQICLHPKNETKGYPNCISKVPNATTSNVNSAMFGKHEVLAEHTWANFFSDANDNVHANANENNECYEK